MEMESANREKYFMKQEIENTDESDNKPKSIVKNVKEVLQIQTPTVMESALGNKELEVQNRRLNAVQETLSSSNSKRKAVDQSDLVGANEHHELKFKSIIGMPKSEFKEHFDIKLECTAIGLEDENNVGNEYLINNEEERGYLKFQSASLQDIDDFRAFKREESSVLKKKRVCVWEDDWDDPDLEDDFSVQLRDELLATWKTFTKTSDIDVSR